MPFKSEAQRRWMHENKPDMAKKWELETPPEPLPDRVSRDPHGDGRQNQKAYKRKSIMRYTKRR